MGLLICLCSSLSVNIVLLLCYKLYLCAIIISLCKYMLYKIVKVKALGTFKFNCLLYYFRHIVSSKLMLHTWVNKCVSEIFIDGFYTYENFIISELCTIILLYNLLPYIGNWEDSLPRLSSILVFCPDEFLKYYYYYFFLIWETRMHSS